VLFDTLMQTCTEEEVVAVLAHGEGAPTPLLCPELTPLHLTATSKLHGTSLPLLTHIVKF